MFNRPINDFETLMTILSATPPLWIPEDDLLLKNAVEAGASLEALAKGAVQFSRKFSVQELQERWHSLLYDPDISAEASARMFELELSASSITPKLSSSGSSSRNMEVPSKRKFESIRSLYHAMRKKTCSQPSNLHGLNVLGSSVANACLGYGSGFQERLQPHNDSAIGDVIHNQFGLKDIGVDILCDPTQDPTLERSARIEFSRTVSSLSDKEMIMHGTFEHTNEHGDSTHVLEKSLVQFGNGSGIEIIGPSGPMPDGMGYSSPQPGLPLWKSVEDISAPIMPGDMIGENVGPRVEEKMINPDNMGGAKINPSEYDSHQEVVLQCGHNGELSSLNALSETDLADISNSLLNFTNDDELTCLESDGKETIDNSSYVSLDSLLVTSNNVHEDDGQNIKDIQASVSETCLAHSNDAFPAELNVVIDQQSMLRPKLICSLKLPVSRYQNEDTKRTIIRLEQSARSSMQRAIASQGALAVLYGRHSKHYIKKSEVILGRATNDFDVDIDLGKEGRPNRISRRQAIIKMDDEGSFFLKNLSKILVCINGKDVSNGEITPLTNNCLIEIRGMGFVFEVDQKSVRRYLEKDKQARNNNFEWSQPER
ncbi:uncharacterized protein LOC110822479 [Carica papaya]|uniref:uncharacterized protein LOC110822479 n=1 Tax=Carica papaya TaxID=3649 RepID=UPI000B8C72F6|nr:uncharacterized protein LOC110822479 [Carica papaya]